MADRTKIALLFQGAGDESVLGNLFFEMKACHNHAQRVFWLVWSASELVGSEGFEALMEQSHSLEQYAEALSAIGLSQIKAIFDRVMTIVPAQHRKPGECDWDFIRSHRDELKNCFQDFCTATDALNAAVIDYLCEHRTDFAEYAEN